MPVLPSSSRFDSLDLLATYAGEFFTERYSGSSNVLGLLCGIAAQQRRIEQASQELLLLQSRQAGPPTACRPKIIHTIVASDRQQEADLAVSFSAPATLANLASVSLCRGRATLAVGFDVGLASGRLIFARDPFLVYPDCVDVGLDSNSIQLEIENAELDLRYLQDLWQPSIKLEVPSSDRGRDLINAVLDSQACLPTYDAMLRALTAAFDVPFAIDQEIVAEVEASAAGKLIVTDRRVYTAASTATVLVQAGDTLQPGQALTDAIRIFEPGRPIPSWLTEVTLTRPMLWSDRSLGFQNADTDLVVQTGVSGYTKVSFALTGSPSDVSAFFTELHTRGVAQSKTLANYLDIRPLVAQVGQPGAGSLPLKVNPLSLLFDFVLQGSTLILKVDQAKFGPGAISGIDAASLVRTMVSPHIAVIVI